MRDNNVRGEGQHNTGIITRVRRHHRSHTSDELKMDDVSLDTTFSWLDIAHLNDFAKKLHVMLVKCNLEFYFDPGF